MTHTQFVTDIEINVMINNSITSFYDLLVAAWGNEYFTESVSFSTTPGVSEYSFTTMGAADLYKFCGLDYNVNNKVYPLKRFNFRERGKYSYAPSAFSGQGYGVMYRIMANKIKLLPIPSGVLSLTLWYIPMPVLPATDASTFDFINGWENFVMWDVVIKCLTKQESDVSVAMAERKNAEDRIKEMRENRDANEGEHVLNLNDATPSGIINSNLPPFESDIW